jgi:hypothetical protein
MSLLGKIFAVLSLVLAVFYAGITAGLLTYQENYKRSLAVEVSKHKADVDEQKTIVRGLQGEKTSLESAVADLQRRVANVSGENAELRYEWALAVAGLQKAKSILDDQEAYIKTLDVDRSRIHNDLLAAGETIKKRDGDITELKGTLDATKARRDQLNDLLAETQKRVTNAEHEEARLVEALKYRSDKLDLLKEKRPEVWKEIMEVREGEVVLPPETNIHAKVVGVDKKLGLVILNVGQKQEVEKGFSFIIYRDSDYVGKVIVQDVTTPDTCVAHYITALMKKDPEVGDDAALRLMVNF